MAIRPPIGPDPASAPKKRSPHCHPFRRLRIKVAAWQDHSARLRFMYVPRPTRYRFSLPILDSKSPYPNAQLFVLPLLPMSLPKDKSPRLLSSPASSPSWSLPFDIESFTLPIATPNHLPNSVCDAATNRRATTPLGPSEAQT